MNSASSKPASPKQRAPIPPVVWPFLGILLLLLLDLIVNPGFLRITVLHGNLFGGPIDILNQGSRGILLALGMTLVIATEGVDLSVGSVMAMAGSLTALLVSQVHAPLPVILAGAIGIGAAAGLISGILVAYVGIQPIVATLIMMVAGRGIAQLLTAGQVIPFTHSGVQFIGNGFLFGFPFSILLVAAIYILSWLFLRKTATGLFIESVGENETASRFAGLSTTRIKCLTYVFCGACAGLAGLMAAANIQAADPYRMGENMELDAIFAVVVGGTALTGGRFLILGSFAGALLLQTLTVTMYNLGVPPAVAPMPKALLIIVVCVAQSSRLRRWLAGCMKRRSA